MNAILALEIELLQPVHLASEEQLLQIDRSHVRRVSIRLTTDESGPSEVVTLTAGSEVTRIAIQSLVALAKKAQPEGTAVLVTYQGRSEGFTI